MKGNSMKFIAVLKQQGEGCDYSIECGKTTIEIDANTLEEFLSCLANEIE